MTDVILTDSLIEEILDEKNPRLEEIYKPLKRPEFLRVYNVIARSNKFDNTTKFVAAILSKSYSLADKLSEGINPVEAENIIDGIYDNSLETGNPNYRILNVRNLIKLYFDGYYTGEELEFFYDVNNEFPKDEIDIFAYLFDKDKLKKDDLVSLLLNEDNDIPKINGYTLSILKEMIMPIKNKKVRKKMLKKYKMLLGQWKKINKEFYKDLFKCQYSPEQIVKNISTSLIPINQIIVTGVGMDIYDKIVKKEKPIYAELNERFVRKTSFEMHKNSMWNTYEAIISYFQKKDRYLVSAIIAYLANEGFELDTYNFWLVLKIPKDKREQLEFYEEMERAYGYFQNKTHIPYDVEKNIQILKKLGKKIRKYNKQIDKWAKNSNRCNFY